MTLEIVVLVTGITLVSAWMGVAFWAIVSTNKEKSVCRYDLQGSTVDAVAGAIDWYYKEGPGSK